MVYVKIVNTVERSTLKRSWKWLELVPTLCKRDFEDGKESAWAKLAFVKTGIITGELIGSLRNNGGDGYKNVTFKVKSRCFKLYRAYSISFISSNVGKIFWSWILIDCIKVQEKKKKVVVLCSRPPKNVKLGTFTPWSCADGKEMYKKTWCTCKVVVLPI